MSGGFEPGAAAAAPPPASGTSGWVAVRVVASCSPGTIFALQGTGLSTRPLMLLTGTGRCSSKVWYRYQLDTGGRK